MLNAMKNGQTEVQRCTLHIVYTRTIVFFKSSRQTSETSKLLLYTNLNTKLYLAICSIFGQVGLKLCDIVYLFTCVCLK